MSNTDENFDERLRKAYEEWSLTYGDTIDESRMEIFSYHFMMAENYFKETGNRIKLNEYADLTAVEFQRLKEMGGMIQDVGGSGESNNNNPHWAPGDAAQMDFFAKQTSQRRQTFQDNSQQQQPETPQPPPGYFSVLPTPEGGAGGDPNAAGMGGGMNNGMGNAAPGFNNGMQATENNPGMGGIGGFGTQPPANGGPPGGDPSAAGVSSFRDPYQQRFTQSYLDSLNTAAKDELVDQTPRPDQPPPPETPDQNNMYNYGVGNNGNDNEQNKYKQPDGFPPENSADKPELQDLINSRYDGIGFLEDSAMVDNAGMDYKFFPALSKMYNLDYPDQEQQNQQDLPPPPPPGMPGQGMGGDGFVPPPPPPGEPTPQERRETFMNAMSTLYSQMFNEDGGPPDADAFEMMQSFMQQASGGVPPPVAGGPPPGQFGVPPQPGTFGGGGAPAGQWSAETSAGPQMADEDLYGEEEPMPPPLQDEEEVGTEIYLGEMSYKMTRGRVIEWLKNIGDEVERGEPLCVVESDTFMMVDGQKYAETHDVVAQEDGVLAAIYIEETETVPVGSVLGVVAADIAEASLVRQTLEQKRMDFEEPSSASTSSSRRNEPEEVFLDENGYPVDADGYLLDSVEVDEDGYPIYDYVDGYPVDEDGYFIEEPEVDADGYPIEDGYDENSYEYEEGGYEEGGYEEEPIPDDGFGAESMYTGPVDDDPDLPSWVLGDAPSIAPAKVASKYPVIPQMSRPAPPPPPPKKVASRTPKRSAPKGGRRPGPKRPRGRIDDVRSPARKKAAEKPKIDGTELTLSELSYGMTKGTVIEWIKNVGDRVTKGEPLAVVESDTFMMIDGQKYAESHDVEASQDGILAATYAGVKETLEVGAVLGIIADNEMAARNVPQHNPYASGAAGVADGPDKPMSRTQRAVAEAIQASSDPEHRSRGAAENGFLDSVEQMEEDYLSQMGGGASQQNDEFAQRFMTQEEKESADFAAAGAYGDGGGGGEQYSNAALDDPDLPSWVRGDAPSLAPAKVASKFPVIPKMGQPGAGSSPSVNAISKAREATLKQESQMYDNIAPPPGRSAPAPRGSAGPPKRRGAPPKRRGAPPKRRGERPSGRGRIDDTRAPLNTPQEDQGTEIVLSELSYGMKKGMIIEWLKNVGDPVKKGDPIAVVESDTFMVIDTQKYAESHDILATDDGILAAQYGGPKELFDVGAVLGMIASSEAEMQSMRRSSPPPPSQADANEYANGYADASSFVPEETNEPGETYYPPPDPAEAATAAGENYLDDPDLPSWVRGDAPSIAPAKVASKFPVIPNMRRGATPPASTPPRKPPAPVNGGTQRRIPKGRYDDTRARPKQIRVEDPSKRKRPRGRIDDIRAPLDSGGGSSYAGGSSYSAPSSSESTSSFFPDLSKPESPKATNKATPKSTEAPEPEEPRFMPDLSSTLKSKKKKKNTPPKKETPKKPPSPPPAPVVDKKKDTKDTPSEPVVEEPVEDTIVAEEEEKEELPEPEAVTDESEDLIEEDVVDVVEDVSQDSEEEDVQYAIVEEGEGEDAVLATDEEIMVDAVDEIEVEETQEADEDSKSEEINGEYDEDEAAETEVEAEEESSAEEEEVIANGDSESPVEEEEIVEEDVVMEESENFMEEDSNANVTAKVDIRDLKKEKTTLAEKPGESEGFDFQEATVNSTEAMVQEILVTAKARTAAEAAKIDLTAIQGTGEAGCITLDDVKLAIARKKPKIGIRFLTDKPKGRPKK